MCTYEDQYTFLIISAQLFLEWEMFRENQNTRFIFSDFFQKSFHLWDNVEKYCRARQATDDHMARVHCMLDA